MHPIQTLTIRTTAALSRLSSLQERAAEIVRKDALVRPVLRELTDALEELQTANDHLHRQLEELSNARAGLAASDARFGEFFTVLPLPCLWTDETAAVIDGNEAASELFNVARSRLSGKPLMLFVLERETFFTIVQQIGHPHGPDVVSGTLTVRPRERRARRLEVTVHRFAADQRWCWFFREPQAGPVDAMLG